MTFHKPTKNSVRVAIAQVVIVVFGVLGTGATQHWWALMNRPVPGFPQWVIDWGWTFLVIPIAWILWYLKVLRTEDTSEEFKRLVFQIGLMIIAVLLVFFLASALNVFGQFEMIDLDRRVEEL